MQRYCNASLSTAMFDCVIAVLWIEMLQFQRHCISKPFSLYVAWQLVLRHLCFQPAQHTCIKENLCSFRRPCFKKKKKKRSIPRHQTALSKCWQWTSIYLRMKASLWWREQKWGIKWQALAKTIFIRCMISNTFASAHHIQLFIPNFTDKTHLIKCNPWHHFFNCLE